MPRKKKDPSEPLVKDYLSDTPFKTTKLDAKFYAAVHKVKDGKSVPDDEWMIFLAKDNAFPATLRFYLNECRQLGADDEHCESVERTIRRLDEWRAANPDRCKVPDAKGEKLLG
jgi:hypothetical protein